MNSSREKIIFYLACRSVLKLQQLTMCEAVQQLGEHFEGRIEAIGKCRELVGDHPEEREEVEGGTKSKPILIS